MYPLIMHLFPTDLTNIEKFPTAVFRQMFRRKWLTEDFTKLCISTIDKCTPITQELFHSDVLGDIKIFDMSGGLKTLLLAKHNPDCRFPISNCGNNCAEALYRSCEGVSTQWFYRGYFPEFLPEQQIYFPETGETVLGKDLPEWELYSIPEHADIFAIQEKLEAEGLL